MLPQVEEDKVLFLHDDTVIYKKGFVKNIFDKTFTMPMRKYRQNFFNGYVLGFWKLQYIFFSIYYLSQTGEESNWDLQTKGTIRPIENNCEIKPFRLNRFWMYVWITRLFWSWFEVNGNSLEIQR